jgi:hypothetical protein
MFADASGSNYDIDFDVEGSTTPTKSLSYDEDDVKDYSSVCTSSWNRFEIKTFILTFAHKDNNGLKFRICSDNFDNGDYFGLRNL